MNPTTVVIFYTLRSLALPREIANQVTEVRDSLVRMPLAVGLSKEH
jgi:hypothetical protein